MKLFYAYLNFFIQPVRLGIDGDAGGSPAGGAPAAGIPPASGGQPGAAAAGTPPTGGTGQAAPAAAAPTGPLIGPDGKFSADFAKEFPSLAAKFTDPRAFVKSHQNLEQMLGKQGKVSIPTATSSPEEIAAYRTAAGVPEKPEGYNITEPKDLNGKPIPTGLWDQKEVDAYSAKFHELGIPTSAAEALVKFGMERGLGKFTDINDLVAKSKVEGEAKLKSEWGADYDKYLGLAEKGARVVGLTAEQVAADPMLANNPTFLRAMKAVGIMSGEDTAAGARGGRTTVVSPDVRLKELQAMMGARDYKKTSDYINHDTHLEEFRNLIRQKDAMRG